MGINSKRIKLPLFWMIVRSQEMSHCLFVTTFELIQSRVNRVGNKAQL